MSKYLTGCSENRLLLTLSLPLCLWVNHCLALPVGGGQRAQWCRLSGSFASVWLPQGRCGYRVAYGHHWVNGWITDCCVKHFGVLWLKLLYKCRSFTIYGSKLTNCTEKQFTHFCCLLRGISVISFQNKGSDRILFIQQKYVLTENNF